MVVVLGADVHKKTHTIVAVDEVGKKIGRSRYRLVMLALNDSCRGQRWSSRITSGYGLSRTAGT